MHATLERQLPAPAEFGSINAQNNLARIAKRLSDEEIATAERMAAEWQPKE